MALLVGAFVYTQHPSRIYDSSLDGSEILEEQQSTIPADVQHALNTQKLAEDSATSHVLGDQAPIRVPILMYHYVEYVQDKGDKTRISLNTTPWTLENEIKTLADAGYTFMTAGELSDALDGKTTLPSRPIVLTFDDGYRDFYTDAYPILKKYHAKATQYVISGFLGYRNHLLASELQQIAQEGLVEIGAHTVHHTWLKGAKVKTVIDEIFQSRTELEKLTHLPIVSFAYPFGAFDQQALEVVRNLGFRSAVSTVPGIDQKRQQRYFLYRLRPGGRTGPQLLAWLESQK